MQLGHGACNEIEAPVAVKSLIDKSVESVECGAEYTLAVTRDGSLYSWGWSGSGAELQTAELHTAKHATKLQRSMLQSCILRC
eukprot:1157186-Pelagomonas_calceolata.AAC.6